MGERGGRVMNVFCFGNKDESVLEWWECFGMRVRVLRRDGVLGSNWVVVISASLYLWSSNPYHAYG